MLDIDSTVQQRSAPKTGKENTIVMNEGFGWWSHCLHGGGAGYFIKQYQDLLDFQKVKFMDIPEIFKILLHIFFLRSRTTIEKLFSIDVLLSPRCITAIETSHKQKENV